MDEVFTYNNQRYKLIKGGQRARLLHCRNLTWLNKQIYMQNGGGDNYEA